jgi:hypothetical protein
MNFKYLKYRLEDCKNCARGREDYAIVDCCELNVFDLFLLFSDNDQEWSPDKKFLLQIITKTSAVVTVSTNSKENLKIIFKILFIYFFLLSSKNAEIGKVIVLMNSLFVVTSPKTNWSA